MVFMWLKWLGEKKSQKKNNIPSHTNITLLDFPCGPVVKNLPANVGDTDSVPGLGRPHMPWGSEACAPLLKPTCPRARALHQEKSPQ